VKTTANRFRISDASIRLDSMPAEGRDLVLDVEAAERETIAQMLDINSLDSCTVTLHAVRFRGGMRVTGRVKANVHQLSVVSLEPVAQAIDEEVDRVFLPTGQKSFAEQAEAEIFVDLEGEDVPDHFEGAEADLTDLIIETLSLGLDPYPRLEGESIDDFGLKQDDDDPSPFARLKVLKDTGGDR
jgi:uncharacterized metal-binding protein YceD (DUF177 family)